MSQSGASWGSVKDTDTLIEAAEELIRRGCTAIAVVARFPEDEEISEEEEEEVEGSTVEGESEGEERLQERRARLAAEAAARYSVQCPSLLLQCS
jgi:predicted HNH restriction endonuclease